MLKGLKSLGGINIRKIRIIAARNIKSLNRINPNIIVFIMYGLLYDAVTNIYKPFAVKFLSRMGGGAAHISLYNSLPGIAASVALLPGILLIRRQKNVKSSTAALLFVSRCFLLVIAAAPYAPANLRPAVFIAVISVMNFPEALSQSCLQSGIASFFPSGSMRAQAISLRNKFGNFSIPLITLIMGLIITFAPRDDSQIIIYYQLFFVLSFVVGLIEIRTFKKFREGPEKPPAPLSKGLVLSVFKNKTFRNYLIFTLIFYVSWQSGWALSSIYQINNLGADEIWLAMFAVSSGLASFFSAGFWSRLIVKKGNGKAMVQAGYLLAFNMIFMALTPNLPVMILACAYAGCASVGMNITLLNGLLQATPEQDRMVYIGVYNTFVNISLGVSPMLSLILINKTNIVYTMLIVGAARIISATLLLAASRKGKISN